MSGSGHLQSDPLFQGLTRPTMILGVSFYYFVVNAVISLLAFINTSNFFIFLGAIATHMLGYYICLKEPRAVEMIIMKASKGYKCINRSFHGNSNSYDPY